MSKYYLKQVKIERKPPFETCPITLTRRQKQIDYGKITSEYASYLEQVPKETRLKAHPKTPDKTQKCSRRSFDGQIQTWRLLLHAYGPEPDQETLQKMRKTSSESNESKSLSSTTIYEVEVKGANAVFQNSIVSNVTCQPKCSELATNYQYRLFN